MKELWTAANAVTLLRIPLGLALWGFEPFSAPFFAVYALGALTDMLDGPLARALRQTSSLGARLDTAADAVFVLSALARYLTAVAVPGWVWGLIAAAALVKSVNIVSGFVLRHRFVAEHTFMNRLTGVLLLLLPVCAAFFPQALQAALADARSMGCERFFCLGDITGYGKTSLCTSCIHARDLRGPPGTCFPLSRQCGVCRISAPRPLLNLRDLGFRSRQSRIQADSIRFWGLCSADVDVREKDSSVGRENGSAFAGVRRMSGMRSVKVT